MPDNPIDRPPDSQEAQAPEAAPAIAIDPASPSWRAESVENGDVVMRYVPPIEPRPSFWSSMSLSDIADSIRTDNAVAFNAARYAVTTAGPTTYIGSNFARTRIAQEIRRQLQHYSNRDFYSPGGRLRSTLVSVQPFDAYWASGNSVYRDRVICIQLIRKNTYTSPIRIPYSALSTDGGFRTMASTVLAMVKTALDELHAASPVPGGYEFNQYGRFGDLLTFSPWSNDVDTASISMRINYSYYVIKKMDIRQRGAVALEDEEMPF